MHIHRRKILKTALFAAATVMLAAGAAMGAVEERPKIFLEKRVLADTSDGRKVFYEVHTVTQGESVWKILNRKEVLSAPEYSRQLREFRRANPEVADPGKLRKGQKVLVPSAAPPQKDPRVAEGKAVPHQVVRGDTLTRLLSARGIQRRDFARYLDAVRNLNDSVRDVDRIVAGSTILLPSERYFEAAAPEPPPMPVAPVAAKTAEPPVAPAPPKQVEPEPVKAPEPPPMPAAPVAAKPAEPPVAPAPPKQVEPEPVKAPEPPAALTREVPPEPIGAVDQPAKPEGQIVPTPAPQAPAPVVESKAETAKKEPPAKEVPAPPPPKPPYRGMLIDLLRGLGEKWADRGTLYLPVPSGGEVVLSLEDFPVARFFNGTQVLIDFHGALPGNIRALITETWKNYRVVSMDGTRDAWEIVRRLLQSAGYHSVKDGLDRPLVIGEGVAVSLPARWVVLRTPESLLSGEVILIKEVPEKPSDGLVSVLRYADRVGIRVLPFATDSGALEGFMVGLSGPDGPDEDPPRSSTPPGGLAALDFALDFLGIPYKAGERLKIGGKGDSFQLTVQPERLFEAGGKRYVADTGKMAPALKALLRDSGYRIFTVSREDSGKGIFQRLLKESVVSFEPRRDFLLAGGEKEGYSVRVTGTFVTSREWLEARKTQAAVLFSGRAHSATRALMRDLGAEIVEW